MSKNILEWLVTGLTAVVCSVKVRHWGSLLSLCSLVQLGAFMYESKVLWFAVGFVPCVTQQHFLKPNYEFMLCQKKSGVPANEREDGRHLWPLCNFAAFQEILPRARWNKMRA